MAAHWLTCVRCNSEQELIGQPSSWGCTIYEEYRTCFLRWETMDRAENWNSCMTCFERARCTRQFRSPRLIRSPTLKVPLYSRTQLCFNLPHLCRARQKGRYEEMARTPIILAAHGQGRYFIEYWIKTLLAAVENINNPKQQK